MKIVNHFVIFLIIFILAISSGAYAYHQVEGWSKLDSVYFVVVTVTTIGYGDLAPETDTGKIFTMFFSFFGIAMAFYLVSLITRLIAKREVLKKFKTLKKKGNPKHKNL